MPGCASSSHFSLGWSGRNSKLALSSHPWIPSHANICVENHWTSRQFSRVRKQCLFGRSTAENSLDSLDFMNGPSVHHHVELSGFLAYTPQRWPLWQLDNSLAFQEALRRNWPIPFGGAELGCDGNSSFNIGKHSARHVAWDGFKERFQVPWNGLSSQDSPQLQK